MKAMQATTLQHGDVIVEDEYVEKSGVLYTNRVIEARYVDDDFARRTYMQQAEFQPWDIERPIRLTIASPGLLDTLQFVDDTEFTESSGGRSF